MVIVRMRIGHSASLLATAAAGIVIATAPNAWAAASEQPCFEAGESTNCQTPGNAQISTSTHALSSTLPHTDNPRYRGVGYHPRWPTLGHNPKWQQFGYDPRWNGFHHRVWAPTTCDFLMRFECPRLPGSSRSFPVSRDAKRTLTATTGARSGWKHDGHRVN
jgi:hypothetical protein